MLPIRRCFRAFLFACLIGLLFLSASTRVDAGPLPSWRDTPTKARIVDFVARVTRPGPDFVEPESRIAVFDNDGTLWTEQPLYPQMRFTLDRVRALADERPGWRQKDPYRAVIENDVKTIAAFSRLDWYLLLSATHADMTTDAFSDLVKRWMIAARHPRFGRPYYETIFLPMRELITYLQANGFKTYIVSGGEAGFMRPWTSAVYGIAPEQIIGSTLKTEYVQTDQGPELMREKRIDLIVEGKAKPIAIDRHIGRRPIFAAGNSDGDYEMLEWTSTSNRPTLCLLIRHTDETREYAYDRGSPVGALERALDDADNRGWQIVDISADWAEVFPAPVDNPF